MWNYEFMAVYALSLTFMNNMTLQVVSYDNKMTVMINNSTHITFNVGVHMCKMFVLIYQTARHGMNIKKY